MKLSRQDYDWLVAHAHEQPEIKIAFGMEQQFYYEGDVVAKQRPRAGRSGKFYTPKETKAFEKKIAEWGKLAMAGEDPYGFPLEVEIAVVETAPDDESAMFSRLGLIYPDKDDIDNIGKAILDGLNGVLWRDDKQIVDLRVRRRWGRHAGFRLWVRRAGLAKHEFANFKNIRRITYE